MVTSDLQVLSADFLRTVSSGPGVYQMLGAQEVLYIGKAKNLRKRLTSYARFPESSSSKTTIMLSKTERVETILTNTEKEALILEASLIKQHKPRYNVILRDDKNYPLIKVTLQEEWPRIVVTRKRVRDGSRYFGPYASGSAMRATLKILTAMFPLRRCKTMSKRTRPCLNYQLGRCLAPCAGLVDAQHYQAMIRQAIMILEGRNRELIRHLEAMMWETAGKNEFERAAVYRDQISALRQTLERQVVVAEHFHDHDVFGFARQDAAVAIAVLWVRAGIVNGVQKFLFNDPIGSDSELLTQAIVQYYSHEQRLPPRVILTPMIPEDSEILVERLRELREAKVVLLVPKRGKQTQLLAMAHENAAQTFADLEQKEQSWHLLATAMVKSLGINNAPELIECLDISNISGKYAVGSLVSFHKGEKFKEGYRHYRITIKDSPDDYAMMREVLTRRFQQGPRERALPDLFMVDGGKGQLNIAVEVLASLGFQNKIELVAIAKEKEAEGEKLFRPGRKNPILLPAHAPVLLFLMRIRDEAHSFGITFHRTLRNKGMLVSSLDGLKGIGSKRKQFLLKEIGSLQRILAATPDELSKVSGIGVALADSIYRQLHHEDDGENQSTP